MSKKPESLDEALAPLRSWSAQPQTPFENLALMLQENSSMKLGFWSSLGLDAVLLLKSITFFRSIAVLLIISTTGMLVVFETPTVQTSDNSSTHVQTASGSINSSHPESEKSSWVKSLNSVRIEKLRLRTSFLPHPTALAIHRPRTNDAANENEVVSNQEVIVPNELQARGAEKTAPRNSTASSAFAKSPGYRSPVIPDAEPSGVTFGIGMHSSAIPTENSIQGISLRELDLGVGYRFNNYHQVSVEYGAQTFRRFNETSHTILVIDVATGTRSYVRTVSYQAVDDLIKVPGIAYTYNAHDLRLFVLEPALTGFAALTSAGFLWRAGAKLSWSPLDHFNIDASYQFEKLNSVDYGSIQSQRTLLGLALDYRW